MDTSEINLIQKLLELGEDNQFISSVAVTLIILYVFKTIGTSAIKLYNSLVKPSDIKSLNEQIKSISNDVKELQNVVKEFNNKANALTSQMSKNDNMTERNKDYIANLKAEVSNIQTLLEILKIKVQK